MYVQHCSLWRWCRYVYLRKLYIPLAWLCPLTLGSSFLSSGLRTSFITCHTSIWLCMPFLQPYSTCVDFIDYRYRLINITKYSYCNVSLVAVCHSTPHYTNQLMLRAYVFIFFALLANNELKRKYVMTFWFWIYLFWNLKSKWILLREHVD